MRIESELTASDKLLKTIDEFTREAYQKFITIKGYEPKGILVAVDHVTAMADIQFSFYDDNATWQEYCLGESRDLFYKVLAAAKELISDFEFKEDHIQYVYNKLTREAELYFYEQDYKWLFEVDFMYLPIEPDNI